MNDLKEAGRRLARQQKDIVVISPHCSGPDSGAMAGGIGTHIYEAYSHMAAGLKPAILLLTSKTADDPPGIDTVKLRLINLPFLYLLSFHLGAALYLLLCHRRIRPRAIHAHYMEMSLLPALLALLLRARLIVTFHGYLDFQKYPVFMRPVMRLTWFTLKHLGASIIVLSEDARQYHQKLDPGRTLKIDIVSNGIISRQVVEEVKGLRPAARLAAKQKKILIFTGRLSPEKNVKELINAFKKLADPGLELWIAGDGPERQRLEGLAEGPEGRAAIRFWGWQPRSEVYKLLSQAHIFVLPSLFEGVPIAMLEAYAFGLKCICVRNPFTENVPGILLLDSPGAEEIKDKIQAALLQPGRPDPDFIQQMSWESASASLGKIYGDYSLAARPEPQYQ